MGLTADDYLLCQQQHLPPGPAWPRDGEAFLTRLLAGLAKEWARIDDRATQLIAEADPHTTSELFSDWERVLGLPDACAVAFCGTQTMDQRRMAMVARHLGDGGQSRPYYIALAQSLGFTISITEFTAHSVDDSVDDLLYSEDWNFAWQVNASLGDVSVLTVDSYADEPFSAWGSALLECVFKRQAQAHSDVIFAYT